MPGDKINQTQLSEYLSPRYREHRRNNECVRFKLGDRDFLAFIQHGQMRNYAFLCAQDSKSGVSFEAWQVRLAPDQLPDLQTPEQVAEALLDEQEDVLKCAEKLSATRSIEMFGLNGEMPGIARTSAERFYSSLDQQDYASRVNVEGLAQKEAKRFETALRPFAERISSSALHALRASADFTWGDYKYYAAENERGEIRRQAAEVYPTLATVFPRRPSLRMAVDRQQSLNGALQQAFGVKSDDSPMLSKGLLKRIQGVEHFSRDVSPERILRSLAELPADWVPANDEDWKAFLVLSETVGTVMKEATDLPLSVLYASCGGKWSDFLRRCARAHTETRPPEGTDEETFAYFRKAIKWKALEKASDEEVAPLVDEIVDKLDVPDAVGKDAVRDWLLHMYQPDCSKEALHNACINVDDMIQSFANQVVLPLAAKEAGDLHLTLSSVHVEEARRSAANILFSGKAAPNILEVALQWHNRAADINEHIASIGEDDVNDPKVVKVEEDGWPPLTNAVVAPNGLLLRPLTNPRELREEGNRLNHCVGSYVASCRDLGHHIISVRRTDGESLSTAEIQPVMRNNTQVRVRQHRSYGNGQPSDQAREAFEWYKRAIENGDIAVNHDQAREFTMESGIRLDDVRKRCSYDWKRKKHILQAMYQWGRFVSKKHRKMTIGEFSQQPEILEVAEAIAPRRRHQMSA